MAREKSELAKQKGHGTRNLEAIITQICSEFFKTIKRSYTPFMMKEEIEEMKAETHERTIKKDY